jgi:uncharacterized glyoxalase superfamily protein PhnB
MTDGLPTARLELAGQAHGEPGERLHLRLAEVARAGAGVGQVLPRHWLRLLGESSGGWPSSGDSRPRRADRRAEEHAMPTSPPIPTVTPMIAYHDAAAALAWLTEAFGFRERTRITMPDGSIGHAEMETGDNGVIMLAEPSPDYQGPARHAEGCEAARRWMAVPYIIDGVHVYVDDVDAHFAQARSSGATILSEPADTGHGASYRAADLEGHRWMFGQRPPASA